MKKTVATLVLIFCVLFSYADSPLTSINFWEMSDSAYILSVGKQSGKKILNKRMLRFLNNPNKTIFDKLSLINAISWEFDSSIMNAETYLKSLKQVCERKIKKSKNKDEERELINSIFSEEFGMDSGLFIELQLGLTVFDEKELSDAYLIYIYLLALDDYTDVSSIKILLEDHAISYENTEAYNFINVLVEMQDLIGKDHCKVSDVFYYYIYDTCITNNAIKKVLPTVYNYIGQYSQNCDYVNIDAKALCNLNTFSSKQGEILHIINYDFFVYGELNMYNKAGENIKNVKIDGDDGVPLDTSDYPIGTYTIVLKKDEDNTERQITLHIIE